MYRKKNALLITIAILGLLLPKVAFSQKTAVKSNLLYGATGTIKIGMEHGLTENTTLDISTSTNFMKAKISRNKRLNHIFVQPEFRYWLSERFSGHFLGAHAHYASYNIGGDNFLLNSVFTLSTLSKVDFKNFHRKGWLLGTGVSYGYSYRFHKRWSIEATLGFGYAYMDYAKYENPVSGNKIGDGIKHYVGPTKAGITLIFMIR